MGGRIDLSTSGYHVINTTADLGQSPVIHGLTRDILQKGENLADALDVVAPLFKQTYSFFITLDWT